MPSSRKTRYALWLVLLPGVLAVTLAWAQQPGNLLANGDFEAADAEGGPSDWSIRDWGDRSQAVAKLTTGGNVGPHCLLIKGASRPLFYGVFSRPLTVGPEPPREMLLSFWYRTVASPEADVSVSTFHENFSVAEWRTPVLTSEHMPLAETKGWKLATWRFPLLPSSQQLTVMLRILGAGELWVDGASLRALPTEVDCQVLEAGLVTDLRGTRRCQVKLANRTGAPLPVVVNLEATAPKAPRVTSSARLTLPASGEETATLTYNYPLDLAPDLVLNINGNQPTVLYDQERLVAPALIDAQIQSPLFRSMVLQTIATPEVKVAGRLRATPELIRQLQIHGQLLGVSSATADATPDETGAFQLALPTAALLSGNYAVKLEALQGQRPVSHRELPVSKRENKGSEVAYDDSLRLCQGGQPIFPLGLFYATEPQDYRDAAEAGFNTLVLPSRVTSLRNLDDAAKLGLSVIVSSANQETSFWSSMAEKYTPRPELLGWYPLQKPDTQMPATPPALMADLYDRLRNLDPAHPVCMSLGSLSRMAAYAPYCDVLLPWTEPEPVGDLRSVDLMLCQAQALAAGRRPVWPIIPMAGATATQDARLDPQGAGRPPTPAEFRCMAYLALARGAQGLFCYALNMPGSREVRPYDVRREAPELWAMVRTVGLQVKALMPALIKGQPVALKGDCGVCAVRALRYEGYVYILAANPSSEPQAVFFTIPDCPVGELSLGFDTGTVTGPGNGSFGDQLPPQTARVYVAKLP